MLEYIKNNLVQNSDQITSKYIVESLSFFDIWEKLREKYDILDEYEGTLHDLVISELEKFNFYKKCFIHKTKLSYIQYFNHDDFKAPPDLKLNLKDRNNDHTGIVNIKNQYHISGEDYIPTGWKWFYCNICVNEDELFNEIQETFWTRKIVLKYGYDWCPAWLKTE